MAAKVLPDWKGSGSEIGSRVATYGKLPHTGEELDESTVRECGTDDDLGGRNTVGLHCGGISSGRIVRASDVQLIKLRMNVVNANAERPRGPGSALKKCQLIWHIFSTLLRGPRVAKTYNRRWLDGNPGVVYGGSGHALKVMERRTLSRG